MLKSKRFLQEIAMLSKVVKSSRKQTKQLQESTKLLMKLSKKAEKFQKERNAPKINQDCRVYIFQQRGSRDGHGQVVVVACNLGQAASILYDRFVKKHPKVSPQEQYRFFKNYSYRSYPCKPGIFLDHHRI